DEDVIGRILDIYAPGYVLTKHQAGVRRANVGEHEVAGASELNVVSRMLRSGRRLDGASERLLVGELIGFAQRDAAVAVVVRRTPQARDQVVSEEGGADAVGFLRGFTGRTRGEKRVASSVDRDVAQ